MRDRAVEGLRSQKTPNTSTVMQHLTASITTANSPLSTQTFLEGGGGLVDDDGPQTVVPGKWCLVHTHTPTHTLGQRTHCYVWSKIGSATACTLPQRGLKQHNVGECGFRRGHPHACAPQPSIHAPPIQLDQVRAVKALGEKVLGSIPRRSTSEQP